MADVTLAEIHRAIDEALPACAGVVGFEPLRKGHGHQSFVIETSAAKVLLKIALRGEQGDKMKSLGHILALAAAHQIPAPKLLHFSEGTGAFGGRAWLVQEFLFAQFFYDFGKTVRRLHPVDVGRASSLRATATQPERRFREWLE